jgi:hypothetical protein
VRLQPGGSPGHSGSFQRVECHRGQRLAGAPVPSGRPVLPPVVTANSPGQLLGLSISLRPDVYEKLEQFVEATGLDRSGVLSLLIQRTEISSVALEPKKSPR